MLLLIRSSTANKKKYRSTERYKEIVLTTPNEVLEVLVIFGPGVTPSSAIPLCQSTTPSVGF